jgi:hypothetical protein
MLHSFVANLYHKSTTMNTAQLAQALTDNHQIFIDYVDGLSEDKFTHIKGDKWTAGQQLQHLLLCLQPISKALASAGFIREKFGVLDRSSVGYDAVIANYKSGLANGGKSPERFLPNAVNYEEKKDIAEELQRTLATITSHLKNYTDSELDSLILPHPFLGALSIRELLYLMSYHPLHHLEQVKANLT